MPETMLQRGSRTIERVRGGSLASAVSYIVLGGGTLAIAATPDSSDDQVELEGGVGVVVRERDYLFARADLVDGVPFTPRAGDIVRETIDGQEVDWVVIEHQGRPAFVTEGITNERVRVHTRRTTAGT